MIRTYYFYDDSFLASNGCSCCEPMEMECYNIDSDEHPDFSICFGSAHSYEDCMEQVLMHEGIIVDGYGEYTRKALEELMVKFELRVVIL